MAILDAVSRVLKKDGVGAVTTNRIAGVAGVSVGSVYQYFPDKRAIFIALHQRHVEAITRLVERALVESAAEPLDAVVRSLIDAMAAAHAKDAELYELLWDEVPHRARGARELEARLQGAFRLALASRLGHRADLDRVAFVVTHMVRALVHAIPARPSRMSIAAAKREATRAILAYVTAT